ncbi:MAG TPA: DUF2905 domain-containing protein [Syntrophomonadaceae bacterium]|nr:DUF2905 domain-containing protein [Syntrophomonadaceae bacterium]
MNDLTQIARILIIGGLLLCFLGLILWFFSRLGLTGWRLPGDIVIKKEHVSFYFPLGTCIVLSIILTMVLYLFRR